MTFFEKQKKDLENHTYFFLKNIFFSSTQFLLHLNNHSLEAKMGAVNRKTQRINERKKLNKVKKEYNCSIFSLCDLRSTSFTVIHFVANYFEEKHLSRLLLCTFLPPNLLVQGDHSPGKSQNLFFVMKSPGMSWDFVLDCLDKKNPVNFFY